MQFLIRSHGHPARVGILPGSFNPPTRAHLALAEAALSQVDEVTMVLPRTLPHKYYDGASFPQRAKMLGLAVAGQPCLSAATSDGGLFVEIARECRAAYGEGVSLVFVCGRDAAERVVNWDYGDGQAIDRILETFCLLVASRQGDYEPPARLRRRIQGLPVVADLNHISASGVRQRIREGTAWEHLVPDAIVPMVRQIYLPDVYSS